MPSFGREEGGTCAPPPSAGPTPCASWPHRYLDSSERPTVGGERPHVTVTVDVQTLRNGHTTGPTGGQTALHNLVLLCRPHHRLVHEGGFRLQLVDGRPVFRRPDGSVIEDGRAPP